MYIYIYTRQIIPQDENCKVGHGWGSPSALAPQAAMEWETCGFQLLVDVKDTCHEHAMGGSQNRGFPCQHGWLVRSPKDKLGGLQQAATASNHGIAGTPTWSLQDPYLSKRPKQLHATCSCLIYSFQNNRARRTSS